MNDHVGSALNITASDIRYVQTARKFTTVSCYTMINRPTRSTSLLLNGLQAVAKI